MTLLAIGLVLADTFAAQEAHADVRDVASRVADQWRTAGAAVSRGPTRFLYEDDTMTVVVPPAPEDGCTTVALIGARGISFHAKVSGTDNDPGSEQVWRAASVAGVLEIGRCAGSPIEHLVVTSDAGRGAIETIVARSKAAPAALRTLLPERSGGALPASAEPGILPPLSVPAKRADVADARARHDGAQVSPRDNWRAGVDGNGEGHLTLAAGCHRVEIFASDPRTDHVNRRFRLDIDAELRDEADDTMLGRDRTDAPDARIDVCVGKETAAALVFSGSPPSQPVLTTHAYWGIPQHIPWTWGPEARGKMAGAMLARHLASPPSEAIVMAQGASGATVLPIAVEPGGCYVAVAAVTHGHARGLGLRAQIGARQAIDERGLNDEAGAVAFCVRDRERARIEVEARGTALAWGLAVFRIESAIWEVER